MSKVYIIGTGPGDEELLTLKAVKALEKCTAVLYDRLISNNVLNYLNEDCEIYYCGKEPGEHYKTQEEINEMIVDLAKKGHIVGRIKGGDPYVFGRGGEEVLALQSENIDFEVISGIPSPISVLNYAGIPITHRGKAQSFHVVTGMSASVLNVNFEALAKENGTLVFMMGLNNLHEIVDNLMEHGKDKETPAAVIMRGTSSKQKKVVGTLQDIEEKVIEAGLKSPCIIVVGEVVTLNEDLAWYEKKILHGWNICTTRSREQSSNLKEKLTELGAEVTEINSIKIESTSHNLNPYLERLEEYDHLLFTSVNGVNIFFDHLYKHNIDIRKIRAKVSVVGKATKKALEKRGIIPFKMAREFVGEGLVKVLESSIKKGERVLIPCSSKSRDYLSDELINLGLNVDRVNIYDTVAGRILNRNSFQEVDIILFTSPSTVNNMVEMIGLEKIKEKRIIAIGPKTLDELKDKGLEGHMCRKHSEDGFLEEITELIKEGAKF